jgi:hypothetical protein
MAGITDNDDGSGMAKPRKRRFRQVALEASGPSPTPGWLRGLADPSPETAAMRGGAALLLLDQWLKASPPCAGVFVMRQALAASRATAARLRFRADETALRDAHHLTRGADDPGPAGRLYRHWRRLASTPTHAGGKVIAGAAVDLGVADADWTGGETPQPEASAANPLRHAAEAARIAAAGLPALKAREAETLAHMHADHALARALGWARPLPLVATSLDDPALKRRFGGVWPQPAEASWPAFIVEAGGQAALAALSRAAALSRRAGILAAAASTVRSEGKEAAVTRLLSDDAFVVGDLIGQRDGLGSDRAARRFIDHMVALGALKVLTERPHLRLFGV